MEVSLHATIYSLLHTAWWSSSTWFWGSCVPRAVRAAASQPPVPVPLWQQDDSQSPQLGGQTALRGSHEWSRGLWEEWEGKGSHLILAFLAIVSLHEYSLGNLFLPPLKSLSTKAYPLPVQTLCCPSPSSPNLPSSLSQNTQESEEYSICSPSPHAMTRHVDSNPLGAVKIFLNRVTYEAPEQSK